MTANITDSNMCNIKLSHKDFMQKSINVDEDYKKLMQALDSFNGLSTKPINKEDLESFPIGKWVDLDSTGTVSIRRRKNLFGDHLNFDTIIKANGKFAEHFHKDVIESCEVIEGNMIDLVDKKTYNKGDVMEYDKGVTHEPKALNNTQLRVIFKP